MVNDFSDIEFVLTNEMDNTMIEFLTIKQMIKNKSYKNDDELKLLVDELDELRVKFIKQFRENNKKQIQEYLDLFKK